MIKSAYQPHSVENNENIEFELLSLFEMTPDLVCIAGKDGYFKKVNPAVWQKFGCSSEEVYSRPVASFIHPDDREKTALVREQLLQGKTLVNFQNRYISKKGETIWLQWTSVYIPSKEIVFAIAKDITEMKQKEKEIEEKVVAYKKMASHFKNRAEEDRKYLASELHEEVAQLAAALKMDVMQVKNHCASTPGLLNDKLDDTVVLTDILIKSIRRLSFSFYPGMLDDLGFHATIEWVCKEFALLNGIPCRFYSDFRDENLLPETKTDLYRLFQEALQNCMDHAEAGEVQVSLRNLADELELSVTDNGKGFVLQDVHHSSGIQHMRQLAASLNGRLSIESTPGHGAKVSIAVKKKYD